MAKVKSNSDNTHSNQSPATESEKAKIASDIINDMSAEGFLGMLVDENTEGVEIIFSDATIVCTVTNNEE